MIIKAKRSSDLQQACSHGISLARVVEDVFWLWNEKLERACAKTIRTSLPEVLQPLWPSQD